MHKGYKCLHIPTGCVYISWDDIFDEHKFFFYRDQPVSSPSLTPTENSILLPHLSSPCDHVDDSNFEHYVHYDLSLDANPHVIISESGTATASLPQPAATNAPVAASPPQSDIPVCCNR